MGSGEVSEVEGSHVKGHDDVILLEVTKVVTIISTTEEMYV